MYCNNSTFTPTETQAAVFTVALLFTTRLVDVEPLPTLKLALAVLVIGVLDGVAAHVPALKPINVASANAFCCTREVRSKRRAGLAANLPKTAPTARRTVRVRDELIVKLSNNAYSNAY